MKVNLFDLFENCETTLPEMNETPCNTENIEQRVMQKIGTPRIRQTKKRRLPVMIAAAAAAVAVFGVTAAAVTGRLDLFRNVLGKTVISDAENLPLMSGNADSAAMEQFMHEDETVFAGSDDLRVSTVGMYSDCNTLMLTLELTPQNGTVLPENAMFVPYFYRADGSLIAGGLDKTEKLVRADAGNSYYLTYYLAAPELAGSEIRAELKNAYTQVQLDAVFAGVQDAQAQWREDYGFESMTVDEWKALWQREDLDGRTADTVASLLESSDAVLNGTWSAEVSVPEAAAPTVYASAHFSVTAGGLSMKAENRSGQNEVGYLVTLTDGTKLFDGIGTSEQQALYDAGILTAEDTVRKCAYGCGADGSEIWCFSEPAEIASVTALLFDYENGVQVTTEALAPQ